MMCCLYCVLHQIDTGYTVLHLYQIQINTLGLRQNGHYFIDSIFKCIFEINVVELFIVPNDPLSNIPALVPDNGLAPNRR